MSNSKLFSRSWMLFAAVLLGACGGNVVVGSGGDGGEGGTSEGGSGTTTTTGNTGGTGGNTGGTGGTTGTGGNTGGTGGTTGSCAVLDQVECVGAFPSCVPVYDDKCCPSCDPAGGCADCINYQFHHCAPWSKYCGGAPPQSCGVLPIGACDGKETPCNADPGGSPQPCGTQPGCVPAYCSSNVDCDQDPVCHPVTAGACTAVCNGLPPPCPPGTAPESDGDCWTGFCIPAELCELAL